MRPGDLNETALRAWAQHHRPRHRQRPGRFHPDPAGASRCWRGTDADGGLRWLRARRRQSRRRRRRDHHRDRLELQLAVEARKLLAEKDIVAYVVSMPCVEWLNPSPREYTAIRCFPPADVSARVAVEAGIAQPWHKLVGDTAGSSRSSTTASRPMTRRCSASSASPLRPSSPPNARSTTNRRKGRNLMTQNPNLAAERRGRVRMARRPIP